MLNCSYVSSSLFPMDCSLPGYSVHSTLQARILKWVVASSFSKGSSWPRNQTLISSIAGRFFTVLSHQGSPINNWYRRVALLLLSNLFHGSFIPNKSLQNSPPGCSLLQDLVLLPVMGHTTLFIPSSCSLQEGYLSPLKMQKVASMPALPTVAFQRL